MTFSLIEQDYYEYNLYAFKRDLYKQNLKRTRLYFACLSLIFAVLVSSFSIILRSYSLLFFVLILVPMQIFARPIFDVFLRKNMRKNARMLTKNNPIYKQPQRWVFEKEDLGIFCSGNYSNISYKNIFEIVDLENIIVLRCYDGERIIPKRIFETEEQKQSFLQKIKEKI